MSSSQDNTDSKPPMLEVLQPTTLETEIGPLLPKLNEWPPLEYPLVNIPRPFPDPGLAPYDLASLPQEVLSHPRTLYSEYNQSVTLSANSNRDPSSGAEFAYSSRRSVEAEITAATPFRRSTQSSPQLPQPIPPTDYYPAYQRQSFTASPPVSHNLVSALPVANTLESSPQQNRKRRRTESDSVDVPLKRLRNDSFSEQPQNQIPLKDEDKLLLSLKDEQGLPWKDIAIRFITDMGKMYQVPALQMRYKRLKERLRVWTDTDVSALDQAYEYWENKKWEIISEKMLDFGAIEKWPARLCATRWQEMNPENDPDKLRSDYLTIASNLPSQRTSAESQSRLLSQSYPSPSYPSVSYTSVPYQSQSYTSASNPAVSFPAVSFPAATYPSVPYSPSFSWS